MHRSSDTIAPGGSPARAQFSVIPRRRRKGGFGRGE